MLIHGANRGGAGINVFNMHQKAKNTLESGADRCKLNAAAVYFEANPQKKEEQASLTKTLRKANPKNMPSVTGMEGYLTVSCSHLSQFCKAILLQCQTQKMP